METIVNLTPDDLRQIIKESVRETLSEKKLKDIFYEVIEDIGLSRAIDEGLKTESINKEAFIKKIKSSLQ